jgi:hypothetical protein
MAHSEWALGATLLQVLYKSHYRADPNIGRHPLSLWRFKRKIPKIMKKLKTYNMDAAKPCTTVKPALKLSLQY